MGWILKYYVVKNIPYKTKNEQDRVKHLSRVNDLEFPEIGRVFKDLQRGLVVVRIKGKG